MQINGALHGRDKQVRTCTHATRYYWSGRASGARRFHGGHADFDSGHPGLLKNFVEGVAVVKVLAAPLGPKVVKNEGAEDVKRLPEAGETAGVVSVEAGRVVLAFDGGLSEQDEWPVDGDVLGSLPFLPDSLKATQARCAGRQSKRQCWGDSEVPVSHVLQVGGIPITCSQVPVGRPWLRVSQIRVPTFLGRALCQILATT